MLEGKSFSVMSDVKIQIQKPASIVLEADLDFATGSVFRDICDGLVIINNIQVQ